MIDSESYIAIQMGGQVHFIRKQQKGATDSPLTIDEKIINFLYSRLEEIKSTERSAPIPQETPINQGKYGDWDKAVKLADEQINRKEG